MWHSIRRLACGPSLALALCLGLSTLPARPGEAAGLALDRRDVSSLTVNVDWRRDGGRGRGDWHRSGRRHWGGGRGYRNHGHRGYWHRGHRGGRFGWWWVVGPRWYWGPGPGPVYVQPRPIVIVPPAPVWQQQNVTPQAYCREYQGDATIDGSGRPFYGTACLQPDGSWRIVN